MNKSSQININKRQLVSLIFILFLILGWGLGGKDPTMYLLYASAFIVFGILLFTNNISKKQSPNKISFGLLIFIGLASISIIWSVNRYETFSTLIPILLAGYLYLVASDFFKNIKMTNILMSIWAASSAILVLIGVPDFITSTIDGRYSGLIGWPNAFAAYTIAPFLFSVYLFAKSKSKYSYLYLACAGILFCSFILTFSRAAFLVMAGLIALCIIIYYKNRAIIKALLISLIIGSLLAGGLYFVKNSLFKNTTNNNFTSSNKESTELLQSSAADRKSYWLSSFYIYRDNLLIGTGLGTFKSVYPKYQRNASAETNYPHSYFLEILSELGILGAAILLVLVIYLFRLIFKNKNTLISISALGVLGIIAHSFLDTDLSYPAILFILVVLLSIISISANDKIDFNQKILSSKKLYKYSLLFLALLLSYFSYTYFQIKSLSNAIILNSTQDRSVINDIYNDVNKFSFNNPKNLNGQANLLLNDLSDQNKNQNIQRAESLVDKSLSINSTNGYTYYLLAQIDYLKGDKKAAKENIQNSILKDPYNNPDAYLLLSKILHEDEKNKEAIHTLDIILAQYNEQVIKRKIGFYPNLRREISSIYSYKASLLIGIGNREEAKNSLEKSVELYPNNYAESLLKSLH